MRYSLQYCHFNQVNCLILQFFVVCLTITIDGIYRHPSRCQKQTIIQNDIRKPSFYHHHQYESTSKFRIGMYTNLIEENETKKIHLISLIFPWNVRLSPGNHLIYFKSKSVLLLIQISTQKDFCVEWMNHDTVWKMYVWWTILWNDWKIFILFADVVWYCKTQFLYRKWV